MDLSMLIYYKETRGYSLEEIADLSGGSSGNGAENIQRRNRHSQNCGHGSRGKCIVFPSPVDVQIDCDDRTMLQLDLLILCDRSKLIRQQLRQYTGLTTRCRWESSGMR